MLDLRGLKCPLPALFARQALRRMGPGQELAVLADDPMAPIDIPHMCHQEGFHVVRVNQQNGSSEIILAVAAASP